MSVFRFEDPPPARDSRRGMQQEAAKLLRETPGKWAVVTLCSNGGSARSMARTIRQGATKTWLPVGDFEAVARTVDGEHRVYARYLGDGGHADE
jgi:hypothetical protein